MLILNEWRDKNVVDAYPNSENTRVVVLVHSVQTYRNDETGGCTVVGATVFPCGPLGLIDEYDLTAIFSCMP